MEAIEGHLQSLHLRQGGLEMQLARGATNVRRLGILADNPVVGGDIPVGDVPTSEGGRPLDGLAGRDVETVKVTEDDFGVVGSAERDIL